jgi:glutamine amidotransferase
MKSKKVVLIDYGVGNLLSVQRAFDQVGYPIEITSDPTSIMQAEKLVLPGVGAFNKAMKAINSLNLSGYIQEFVKMNRPILGICLGMQLLFDSSDENGNTKGLGLISGKIVPIKDYVGGDIKVPHIGWQELKMEIKKESVPHKPLILDGISHSDNFYFVHSFIAIVQDRSHLAAYCTYGGIEIPAVVAHGNIMGCQFHPEKSGKSGLRFIKNFCEKY